MIVKGIVCLLSLIIIPELLGMLILRFFEKEKTNLIFAFVIGYLAIFAICQLVTVPLIYANASLTLLIKILVAIFSVLSILSIIVNITNFKNIFKSVFKYIKEMPKFYAVVLIVLIGIQMYAYAGYMHIDDDDAFYVGTATTAVQTDTLMEYSGSTGETHLENRASRYRLGPFPLFSAIIAVIIDIHPAIVAHTILPLIFVPLVYMVYGLIGDELFKRDSKKIYTFLMLMCLINMWGNYSVRTNFSFMLLRIWQGKALLANLIIPAVLMLFIKMENSDYKLKYCFLVFITMIAGVFTTTMGIGLPPIELMVLAFVYEISKINFKRLKDSRDERKNIKIRIINFIKCLMCCIPAIAYGIAYILI